MRVIAGTAKSLRLQIPRQGDIRPTTDAIRETLFASLGPTVVGARFADLYAGTGAVGIEALSRGAARAIFIENNPHCTEVIQINLANTTLAERAVIIAQSLPECWSRVCAAHGPFDIVFVDPPYASVDIAQVARRLLGENEGLAREAVVIFQHDQAQPPVTDWLSQKTKVFGQSRLDFYYAS